MEVMTIIFSMVSLILSIISMIIGIIAVIELRSFMKSTHKIEFMPLDQDSGAIKKEPMVDDELKRYGLL